MRCGICGLPYIGLQGSGNMRHRFLNAVPLPKFAEPHPMKEVTAEKRPLGQSYPETVPEDGRRGRSEI